MVNMTAVMFNKLISYSFTYVSPYVNCSLGGTAAFSKKADCASSGTGNLPFTAACNM